MTRLGGVDLPKNKRIEIGLTYIYGIGLSKSQELLANAKIDPATKVKDLAEADIVKLRDALREETVEGDLRRKIGFDIKRLIEIGCYRGQRHRKSLPCRGQRTRTNGRTNRKGGRKTVANKKKVTK